MAEFVTNECEPACRPSVTLRNSLASAEAGVIGEMPVISVCPCVPALVSASIVATQAGAVIFQFAQGTDSRFPLLYFSVDSAALAALVALLALLGWQDVWSARARLTSGVGVLVSAIVFATVIVPASQTGTWFQPHDDLWAWAATVLMHGVAPALVTLDFLIRNSAHSIRSSLLWSYVWPLIYSGVLIVLALIFGSNVIPYPFLRPASMGWPMVAVAVVALAVLVGVLGVILGVLSRAAQVPGGRNFHRRQDAALSTPHNISNGPTSMKVGVPRVMAEAADEKPDRDDPYAGVALFPDLARASNPWRQIVRDMYAPAPMSHWASDVTTVRIRAYDQIRPFVTRGALLAALAILLCVAPGTWWLTFVLLVPAAVQVVLEIVVDRQLAAPETTRVRALKPLVSIAEKAHSRTLVNVTGVIGVLAVPCNIVAVCYSSGPGQPSWVKVLALGAAAAYGVSAMVSLLIDSAHYSAHLSASRPYRLFHAVRPHLWLVAGLLMAAMVAGSVVAGRWAEEMVPLAWAMCLFPWVIGMKLRDYERIVRASSELLPDIQRSAKEQLAKDFHNTYTQIRVFNRDLARNADVPAEIQVKAAALAPLISLMSEAVDHDQWVSQGEQPSLAGIAEKCASDGGLKLSADIRLADLNPENSATARTLLTALLVNVGQAMKQMRKERSARADQWADEQVTVTGEIRDEQVHISVRDPLPAVQDWCREGSTTRWLHEDLIARGGSGLVQHLLDIADPSAGKEIRASWPVKRAPLSLTEDW